MDWEITATSLTRVGPDQPYILEIHKNHFKQVIRGKAINNTSPLKRKKILEEQVPVLNSTIK